MAKTSANAATGLARNMPPFALWPVPVFLETRQTLVGKARLAATVLLGTRRLIAPVPVKAVLPPVVRPVAAVGGLISVQKVRQTSPPKPFRETLTATRRV